MSDDGLLIHPEAKGAGDKAELMFGVHAAPHEWRRVCDEDPPCAPVPVEDVELPPDPQPVLKRYVTLDSGQREEYDSGMRRDVEEGKPRFDLIFPEGVPYRDQLLTRFAELLARGAEKYGENNWQLANSLVEYRRFKRSGLRHMLQWMAGEIDEDHAAAVLFNIMAAENTKRKIDNG